MKANKYYLLYLFILGFVFYACDKPVPRKNEITKIEIATGSCFGPCQPTIVSIDSSLNYKYFGAPTYLSHTDRFKADILEGWYLGKITRGYWDTLNIKLEKIKYKQLYLPDREIMDDQPLEIFIHYNNKVKHIETSSASLTDSVRDVLYYIINSYKTIKPKRTNSILDFESKFYYPKP